MGGIDCNAAHCTHDLGPLGKVRRKFLHDIANLDSEFPDRHDNEGVQVTGEGLPSLLPALLN